MQNIAKQDPSRARKKSLEGPLINFTQPHTRLFPGAQYIFETLNKDEITP